MSSLRKLVLPLAALLLFGCQSGAHTTLVTPSKASTPTPASPLATPTRSKAPLPPVLSLRQFQKLMTKDGYPVGSADGKLGPRTEQGVCALRSIFHDAADRGRPTKAERRYLPEEEVAIPIPLGHSALGHRIGTKRAIVVDQHCQTAYLILEGKIVRIITVSTGGHYQFFDRYNGRYEWADTPRGLFRLEWKQPGKVTSNEVNGVMYYPWFFHGGAAVHGEADPAAVPPYPVSHGCVRMKMADILFIWKHFKVNDPVLVYGTY